jgi:trans-aconitate methyltransferase
MSVQGKEIDWSEVDALAKTDVFYQRYRNDLGKKMLLEAQLHDPIEVDFEANDEQLQIILEHIQEVWTRLGEEDPHWSVASAPIYRAEKIKETIGQFNNSGKVEADNLKRLLKRIGMEPVKGVALEYGCGVGRVTRWLSDIFPTVIGVDISATHLTLADEYFKKEALRNVSTIKIASLDDVQQLPLFDFLYSKIVLQHNPPPVIYRIMDLLCQKLNSGGQGVVQIPTYCIDYRFNIDEYISSFEKFDGMEMHVLPQYAIFDVFQKHGCRVKEVFRDHMITRMDFVSSTIVFEK